MYFTDESLYPENEAPLIITAAPYGPAWVPGDASDIPVTWKEQVQAARLGGLDVAGGPVDLERGQGRARERVLDEGADLRAGQDVEEARATVRHRQQHEVVVRALPAPALGDRLRRLRSGQRPAEAVRSDHHAHGRSVPGT